MFSAPPKCCSLNRNFQHIFTFYLLTFIPSGGSWWLAEAFVNNAVLIDLSAITLRRVHRTASSSTLQHFNNTDIKYIFYFLSKNKRLKRSNWIFFFNFKNQCSNGIWGRSFILDDFLNLSCTCYNIAVWKVQEGSTKFLPSPFVY